MQLIHTPLDPVKAQIRLFRFEGTNSDGTLEFVLRTFPLPLSNLDVPYCALSYAWGSPSDAQIIRVNGSSLTIRKNLHAFFLNLFVKTQRDSLETEWFWADQLSIDQSNVEERNRQVANMSVIYSRAQTVHAWTGRYTREAREALEAMLGTVEVPRPPDDRIIKLVEDFCTREYWSRLWIVQELRLAMCARYWCGTYSVFRHSKRPVDMRGKRIIGSRGPMRAQVLRVYRMQSENYWGYGDSTEKKSLSFSEAVINFSAQLCDDPRDKIFGLQAVVHPGERLVTNYHLTIEQLFTSAVLNIIKFFPKTKSFVDMRSFNARIDYRKRDLTTLCQELLSIPFGKHTVSPMTYLCWAHWILFLPDDLTHVPESRALIWANVAKYAVTTRQQRLAQALQEAFDVELFTTFDDCASEFRRVAYAHGFLSDVGIPRSSWLYNSLGRIPQADFLLHPEDPPLEWRDACDEGIAIELS